MTTLLRITRILNISKGLTQQFLHLHTVERKTSKILPQVVQQFNNVNNNNNSWIWQKEDKMHLPISNINPIELPHNRNIFWIPPLEESINPNKEIIEPEVNKINIEAARLIVIRRKKMKKHKLRKLRKKMKYEWAKIRQRRELKKEKEFQAVLIKQCKEADHFSAQKYVQDKIDKLNEIVIPKRWKGRRLPEFLIREKLGLPPK